VLMSIILASLFFGASFGAYLYVSKNTDVLDEGIVLVERLSEINTGNLDFCIESTDCMLVADGWCKIVTSINRDQIDNWTIQDEVSTEISRQGRHTCKAATKEARDISNYESVCFNNKCAAEFSLPTSSPAASEAPTR